MEKRLDEVFSLYKTVLLAHIGTKTDEPLFHEKSADFYEVLFKVFHLVSEKRQDVKADEPYDCEEAVNDSVSALERALEIVEDMVSEKNTVGMDNLLRGLADELETHIGNARAFQEEEKEEYEPKKE